VRELLLRSNELSASIDSTAYRLVRNFRFNTRNLVFSELNNSFSKIDEGYHFRSISHQIETPLWQLINQQPENFLMRPLKSWSALLNESLQQTINDMTRSGTNKQQALVDATWGQQNTSAIKHPLSDAIPFLGMWLDMPSKPLSGDS
jgi:penicillin amidase